jgi:hypothetical protein
VSSTVFMIWHMQVTVRMRMRTRVTHPVYAKNLSLPCFHFV